MKIFDSSSIISIFREAKCPEVLINSANRGYKLIIPETVQNELKRNKETWTIFLKYKKIFEIRGVDKNCLNMLSIRYPYLHKGEIGVICTSLEEKKDENKHICILDEEKARNLCKRGNITTTGLIGFLKWQKNIGDLNDADCKKIYKDLYNSRFRISKSILEELIK